MVPTQQISDGLQTFMVLRWSLLMTIAPWGWHYNCWKDQSKDTWPEPLGQHGLGSFGQRFCNDVRVWAYNNLNNTELVMLLRFSCVDGPCFLLITSIHHRLRASHKFMLAPLPVAILMIQYESLVQQQRCDPSLWMSRGELATKTVAFLMLPLCWAHKHTHIRYIHRPEPANFLLVHMTGIK